MDLKGINSTAGKEMEIYTPVKLWKVILRFIVASVFGLYTCRKSRIGVFGK